MPSPSPLLSRAAFSALLMAASVSLGGCGEKPTEQSSTVQMKDLEAADGTINDSMTDLDGVKSEGTALADTGTANASVNLAAPTLNASVAKSGSGAEGDGEVVADQ